MTNEYIINYTRHVKYITYNTLDYNINVMIKYNMLIKYIVHHNNYYSILCNCNK